MCIKQQMVTKAVCILKKLWKITGKTVLYKVKKKFMYYK